MAEFIVYECFKLLPNLNKFDYWYGFKIGEPSGGSKPVFNCCRVHGKCVALAWVHNKFSLEVWFQNRRAKWRKQARLQLLQGAWKMRWLSLGSQPVIVGGGRGANNNSNESTSASQQQVPGNLHSRS